MIDNVTQAAIENTANNNTWLTVIIVILFICFVGYTLYQMVVAD